MLDPHWCLQTASNTTTLRHLGGFFFAHPFFNISLVPMFNYLCMWLRRPCSRLDIGHTPRTPKSHRKPQENSWSQNRSPDESGTSQLQPRGQRSPSLWLRVDSEAEPWSLWRKLCGTQRGSVLVWTSCQVIERWRKRTTRASFLWWRRICGGDPVAHCSDL